MIVAILGTTISPYLFFWQASQEIEEQKAAGRRMVARRGATRHELGVRGMDVGVGTLFSNLVMYFIILTTALTLHRHGITDIETCKQAAEALIRLGGQFAALLFTIGVLGVGFLAIPTLAGSAAYAYAETFGCAKNPAIFRIYIYTIRPYTRGTNNSVDVDSPNGQKNDGSGDPAVEAVFDQLDPMPKEILEL
jgi:Mn2+/Fe2+ NRAMP family transporter